MYELPHELQINLKTWDLSELGTFKKTCLIFGIRSEFPAGHPKLISLIAPKKLKKQAAKLSIESPILLDFVCLSQIFCPWLSLNASIDSKFSFFNYSFRIT